MEAVNVGGTRNVLDAAAAIPKHRVVVVSSTAAINCSDSPHVFDERTEFQVRDPELRYAHAKHRAELHTQRAFERGLPVIVVNPSEVYGPLDTALHTAAWLEELEGIAGKPVLTANQVSFWKALRLAGDTATREGLGTLLRTRA